MSFLYPPWTKFRRVYRNHSICLSVCPSMRQSVCLQVHVRPITFFCLTLANHIWHMGVSQWDDVSCTFMIHIGCWPLTSLSNLYRVFDMFSFPAHNLFFGLTLADYMFGTWVYYHERMCHRHSLLSQFNIDLWPQGQIYRFLSCLCVQPSWNFCLLWHWHTLFTHGSIITRGWVAYIHDPDMMLTFDLNVKFIGFTTNLIEIRSFHLLNHSLHKHLFKPLFSHVSL